MKDIWQQQYSFLRSHSCFSVDFCGHSLLRFTLATNALAQQPQELRDQLRNISMPESLHTNKQTSDTSALNWVRLCRNWRHVRHQFLGSWVVPTVTTGTSYNVAAATWVGIGGVESKDLIQAWARKLFPNSDGTLSLSSVDGTFAAGFAHQCRSPFRLEIQFQFRSLRRGAMSGRYRSYDITSGRSYSTSVNYDSSLSSADWIEEMPVVK